jgi:N-acetylneuraminate synthase/N,N'-diacetyllegionaminate synthase
MAYLSEVAAALEFLDSEGAGQVGILQCISNYPAPLSDQNLACIATMARAFGRPTGLSDHTRGPWAAIAARGLGMAILEKHITLDRDMPGPDHRASMEPAEFTDMVGVLREVEKALGDGVKRPAACELDTRQVARKSLVFAQSLPAGHVLEKSDLRAKRPGGGLPPVMLDAMTGRRLKRPVNEDEALAWDDVC